MQRLVDAPATDDGNILVLDISDTSMLVFFEIEKVAKSTNEQREN